MTAAVLHLGTLAQWLTLFSLLALGVPLIRGARSTAITNLRHERDELEHENRTITRQLADTRAENAKLAATRDLEPILQRVVSESRSHEERAQERFDKTAVLLELIAERLGPDPNHHRE